MVSPERSWRHRGVAVGVTCVLLASACSRGTSHKAQRTTGRQNVSAGTSDQTSTGETTSAEGATASGAPGGEAGSATGAAGGSAGAARGGARTGGAGASGGG